jgi:hypothetical protein
MKRGEADASSGRPADPRGNHLCFERTPADPRGEAYGAITNASAA